jgi:ABC-type uncharacterized transport system auxiliary subunit
VRSAGPVSALVAALALAGCAAGPAPRDHFYRIETGAPPAALDAPALDGTLEVGRLRADALTLEGVVLYRDAGGSGEVRRNTYHRWVDAPTSMLQTELTEYLRASNAATVVGTPELHLEPSFVLSGRILRLERIVDGGSQRASVALELSVRREPGHDLVLLETYRREEPAEGDRVADSVDAFNRAVASIFERFVSDLAAR